MPHTSHDPQKGRAATVTAPRTGDPLLAPCDPAMAFRVSPDTFPILTDPRFVDASRAEFMRADDWIVGLRVGEQARCYPAHMLDNVHVVNDTIDGRPVAVMHCEICCSNAVFLATLDDRRLTFGTGGLFGGTLALFDEQTGSLWSHGMGAAIDGPLTGRRLVRIESFQASYAEWLALYPDTAVMTWPAPVTHPDARHGHGTDAWFAQPGIEPLVLRTMRVREDARLPEHDMIVSLLTADGTGAIPLRELIRAGGLIRSSLGGHEFVTLLAGPDSALSGTFRPSLQDAPDVCVDLRVDGDRFLDRRSGSEFRVDGLAVSGPLAGRRLEPFATMTNKWHSLICFVPDITIARARSPAWPSPRGRWLPCSMPGDRAGSRSPSREDTSRWNCRTRRSAPSTSR